MMTLTADEFDRYSQQLKLKEVGAKGQLKLKAARVLCVGAGGLGSPLLLYLAAAGIGTLGIVDPDVVQLNNLHRQILYRQSDIGLNKAVVAKEHLLELNPEIHVVAHDVAFNHDNAAMLVSDYDVIADCTDNFDAHYLIQEICFEYDKPSVFAAIHQYEGQCSLFLGKQSPCYRCLFPTKPKPALIPNCRENGVLGVLPGFLGVMQANELLKYFLGLPHIAGKLLCVDTLTLQCRSFTLTQNKACLVCGVHP